MPSIAGTAAGQEPAVPLPGPRRAPVPDDVDRATLMTRIRQEATRFGKLREEVAVKYESEAQLIMWERNLDLPSPPGGTPQPHGELLKTVRSAIAMTYRNSDASKARAMADAVRNTLDVRAPRVVTVGGTGTGTGRPGPSDEPTAESGVPASQTAGPSTASAPRREVPAPRHEAKVCFADGTKPGSPSAGTPKTKAKAKAKAKAKETVESQLDRHRPPRIDGALLPPPIDGSPVTFSDASTMPTYLTGDGTPGGRSGSYGQSRVVLRGTDQVVDEIASRTGLSHAEGPHNQTDVLDDLRRALRDTPWVFHGDGYQSPAFTDVNGRDRALRVVTRPHNNWERFADDYGSPFKFDGVQRSQVTSGYSAYQSTSVRVAPSFAIGPPSGGLAAYGRVGGGFGYTRSYEYGMQDQTLSQAETRMGDSSHLHLDDVQYEVHVVGPAGASAGGTFPGESHFSFGVRNGLTVRLPDSETAPGRGSRVPDTMTIDPNADYRLVHTEGYGPVGEIRRWALNRLGAEPGDPAYDETAGFFTSENFHRMADRTARGRVPTRPLRAGKDGPPRGAFVVDRVVPGKAVRLTGTKAAEMRLTVQQAIRNERSLAKTYSQQVFASAGPSADLTEFFGPHAALRSMIGAFFRYTRSSSSGTSFGGTANRKIVGQVKKVPTNLYLVEKTVYVRKTGDEQSTPFTTWSLDRMTRAEARRLGGWDDGTLLRKRNNNEPFAPVYLTREHPAVLGMSRPEAFVDDAPVPTSAASVPAGAPRPTFLETFTDQVIRAASAKYPGMIAPLDELGDPSDSRWRNHRHYQVALQNTLNVINTLSHHAMAGNLETVVTTGLRIGLIAPGRFTRAHRQLLIEGTLTDRRFEGTDNDELVRVSAPGTEKLDGQQNVVRSREFGADASFQVRASATDTVARPTDIGSIRVGPRWGLQKGERTGFGSTVSFESLHSSTSRSHLHSYRLELTAKIGGYRRFRSVLRGVASVGLLGTHFFVFGEPLTDLVGGKAGNAVSGRVVLAVPDEHTPETDPHTSPADREPLVEALTPAQAKALAAGDRGTTGAVRGHASPFGDHPYHVISVGAHKELAQAAEDILRESSNGSWHVSEPGAPAHDAALRPLQSQYLTANFDQSSGDNGTRVNGLFGQGPYLNRLGFLVHRTRVVALRAVSKPVKIQTEQTLGAETQTSGGVSTARSFTVTGDAVEVHTHDVGPSLAGTYGLLGSWTRSRATTRTVSRTALADMNPVDDSPKVLLVGDTQHELAATVRGDGLLAPVHSLVTALRRQWAGRRLRFGADWVGHVTEKVAHRLGIIKDYLGDVPRYTAQKWRQPQWLRENPFGAYPVNSLDTTEVLAEFEAKLLAEGVDDAGRDRLRSMVTPRAMRALREHATSSGVRTRTRIGGWLGRNTVRIGGRDATLTMELVAEKQTFDGLGHSTVLKDGRHATETSEVSTGGAAALSVGALVAEAVRTGHEVARAAGPTLVEQGTSAEQSSHARTSARLRSNVFYPNEPHAEFLTEYRLRLSLDRGDGAPPIEVTGDVGHLREQLPLSLAVPETADEPAGDPLAPPRLAAPDRTVTFWETRDVTADHIERWRVRDQPGGRPFTPPDVGYAVRRVVGQATLRDAGVLAGARAYGTPIGLTGAGRVSGTALDRALEKAGDSGLTRAGTASSLALHDGMSSTALSAFYADTTERDGYQVAGLSEDTFAGGAHGEYRLYSRPDFRGATLLAVSPDSSMESTVRDTSGGDSSVGRAGTQQIVLAGGAATSAYEAGRAVPGLTPADGSGGGGEGHRQGGANSGQVTLKPTAGRAFLFAVPTRWLGVGTVERHFKDSATGRLASHLLGPFGFTRPGPQAVETESQILAWVREDVARQLGLITDANFPSQVADAWSAVTKSAKAWVDADNAYWKQRRALRPGRRELHDTYEEQGRALVAAKAEAERTARVFGAGSTENAAALRRVQEARSAVLVARNALEEGRRRLAPWLDAAERAAAEFHRVRAETDRLTRWHRLPSGDEPVGDSGSGGRPHRQGVPEPAPVTFKAPAPVVPLKPAPTHDRFTETPGGAGTPETLTPPAGIGGKAWQGAASYTVHDVPRDGDGFFHAFAEALHHTAPTRLSARVPIDDRATTVAALRSLFADELTEPGNTDLLDYVTPDTPDTFTREETTSARVDFDPAGPEHKEFTDTGHLPLHGDLDADRRARLARALLLRPGDADGEAGWNHSASDLLPALAARTFAARITVVGKDGLVQDFGADDTPPDKPHLVLSLKDEHFRYALPTDRGENTKAGADASAVADAPRLASPLPPTVEAGSSKTPFSGASGTPTPVRRVAHMSAPWNTPRPGSESYFLRSPSQLVGPDGAVYRLEEPRGDGNGFWSAFAETFHRNRYDETTGRTVEEGSLLNRLTRQKLPDSARLTSEAAFTHEELLWAKADRSGGRVSGALTEEQYKRQRDRLIKIQLASGRGWDEDTATTAAEVAAASYRTTVVIVNEDGSHVSHSGRDLRPDRRITLYQRGSEYLLALPQTPSLETSRGEGNLPDLGADAEYIDRDEPMDGLVTRDDLAGLRYGPQLDLAWQLAPAARFPVGQAGLAPPDRAPLLERRPDLDPAPVERAPVVAHEDVAPTKGDTSTDNHSQADPEVPDVYRQLVPQPSPPDRTAAGVVPDPMGQPDDVPTSRREPRRRHLESYEREARAGARLRWLRRWEAGRGVSAPDSGARDEAVATHDAAEDRLRTEEAALRAWGARGPRGPGPGVPSRHRTA
ncbi:hypothetical protein ACWDYK_29775 [Streptomyces anthocyanicus]